MERNRQVAASACPDGNFHSPMLKCVANQRPSLQEGSHAGHKGSARSLDRMTSGTPARARPSRCVAMARWRGSSGSGTGQAPRLGYPDNWPQSLKTAVGLLLPAAAQIVLFWGPEFVAIYNDAYAPTIGDKHPRALGRPAVENWAELWDDLRPLLQGVRDTGDTVYAKDRPFYIERHGYPETVYFDISYSAVPDESGAVGGVLCIVSETTERVVGEQALRENEERLRLAVNNAEIGFWDVQEGHGELTWPPRTKAMFGISADVPVTMEDFFAGLHPDDLPRVAEAYAAAADPARRSFYDVEYRTIGKEDGVLRWVAAKGRGVFDSEGPDWAVPACHRHGGRDHAAQEGRGGAARERRSAACCSRGKRVRNVSLGHKDERARVG